MARQALHLGEQAFIWINSLLIFLSLTANIFYAWCLIFPLHSRQKLKQPLKTLLGYLVWCSIIYCASLPLMYFVLKQRKNFEMLIISWVVVLYFMYSSMTCYVWLILFYYIQIVPANRALSIWVKRNIRSVIYVALLLDGTLFLFNSVMNIADVFSRFTYINGTGYAHRTDEVCFSSQVCFFIFKVHILICLCIMTVSSFSTAHYLFRHMRNMAQSGSCFYTPRIQSQMRVTITGISQGVLYFLYDTFHLLDSFAYMFAPDFYFSYSVSFTVTSLYISGTTINLGIGQAIFRQRAAAVWRALKALCGVAIVIDDMKLHSGQVTSGEIANTLTVNSQMTL